MHRLVLVLFLLTSVATSFPQTKTTAEAFAFLLESSSSVRRSEPTGLNSNKNRGPEPAIQFNLDRYFLIGTCCVADADWRVFRTSSARLS
jgi:hypothetical protein